MSFNLGNRIRHLREAAGFSQSKFEKETGIKREYLSKLETGDHSNPTFNTLQKLSIGLKIDLADLVTNNQEVVNTTTYSLEEQKFFTKLQTLSPEHQQQALDFIAFLEYQERANHV